MKNKGGIEFQNIENIIVLLFAAVIVGMLIWRLQVDINVKNVIEENEVLINRKILYAKVLLSSSDIAYTDENGIHKGIIDYQAIKELTNDELFRKYSYQPDGISKGGYSHFVRIDVLETDDNKPKTEATFYQPPFLEPITPGELLTPSPMEFPINIRYANDDIRLGKLYIDIIKS